MDDDERRTESRLQEQTTIFLETITSRPDLYQPQVIICHSVDLSANGILVQIDEPVAAGTILRLCAGGREQDLYLVAEVKWARPEGEQFNLGLEIFDAQDTDIVSWKKLIAEKLQQQLH